MLEIPEKHFLLNPGLLIEEMRSRGWPGSIKLPDGSCVLLQWCAAEAVHDPVHKI